MPKSLVGKTCFVMCIYVYIYMITPPRMNIEPENDGLEDDFPFPGVYSQVSCYIIFRGVCNDD